MVLSKTCEDYALGFQPREEFHSPACNILWLGYPRSLTLNEGMLQNSMMTFGEFESIQSFPVKKHAFIVFRSIDAARRAKEDLESRLLCDPRISVKFAVYGIGCGQNLSKYRDPRPRRFVNEPRLGGTESSGLTHAQLSSRGPNSSIRSLSRWSVILARGGSRVCRALCVPMGKGLESALPEVVNCFWKVDLDELGRRYAVGKCFGVVYFYPDSVVDVASFNAFRRYLSAEGKAGGFEYGDGKYLFIVPPSDFISKIVKCMDPRRLYGVVLELNSASSDDAEKKWRNLYTLEIAKTMIHQSQQNK